MITSQEIERLLDRRAHCKVLADISIEKETISHHTYFVGQSAGIEYALSIMGIDLPYVEMEEKEGK